MHPWHHQDKWRYNLDRSPSGQLGPMRDEDEALKKHVPETCSQCGVKIAPKQHPHTDAEYQSNGYLSSMGPQWTCGCATWGPADGSTFNPFELDCVP